MIHYIHTDVTLTVQHGLLASACAADQAGEAAHDDKVNPTTSANFKFLGT